MQALFSKIKNSNHILLVFCLFGIRAGIFGASIGDALFFIGFMSLIGYREYIKSKEIPDINVTLKEELKELKDYINANQLKEISKQQEYQQPNIKRYF